MSDPVTIPPEVKTILAGALGGLVRWLTLRERWQDGLASMTVGAICAYYAAPALHPQISTLVGSGEGGHALTGFLVGIGGIVVVGLVIDGWRTIGKRRLSNQEKRDG